MLILPAVLLAIALQPGGSVVAACNAPPFQRQSEAKNQTETPKAQEQKVEKAKTEESESADSEAEEPDHDEGAAPADIRCGNVLVRGSDQFTQAELARLLGEAIESPFDQAGRDLAQAAIIKEYNRRGFFDAAVSWSDPPKGSVPAGPAAILTIKEGHRYTLRRLEFVGNEFTRDVVIRRRVAQTEGDPFDEELVDLSIDRLNRLGIFELVSRQDVEVKINRKGHFVDILINVMEKPRD